MKKSAILLVCGLFILPNLSFAGFDSDKFSLGSELITSVVSVNSDDNDNIVYSSQLRVGMEVKADNNMVFGGQLYGYKYMGELDQTFDKTNFDTLRIERLHFKWWNIVDSNFSYSIGRRPFFYGQTTGVSNDGVYSGTPYRTPSDFNVDGATIGYFLEPLTGITGMNVRLCYGLGIKEEWGNGTRATDKNLEGAKLAGISFDLYHDDKTLILASFFRAHDINDSFNGTFAFPTQYATLFAQDMEKFPTLNFATRYVPTTTIGDINLIDLNVSHEFESGFVLFGSIAMTQLRPNGKAGMFGGMGSDAVFQGTLSEDGSEIIMSPSHSENNDHKEGYGIYVGMQIPAPMGEFGLEYNYGSKYWTPINRIQDDALGNKLATRGHVGEAYYILNVSQTASIKIGAIYYDYEYSGSGSPVGKPNKISDIKDGAEYSLLPVVDTAWDAYAKLILTF